MFKQKTTGSTYAHASHHPTTASNLRVFGFISCAYILESKLVTIYVCSNVKCSGCFFMTLSSLLNASFIWSLYFCLAPPSRYSDSGNTMIVSLCWVWVLINIAPSRKKKETIWYETLFSFNFIRDANINHINYNINCISCLSERHDYIKYDVAKVQIWKIINII